MNIWPRGEASRANLKFWEQSLLQEHYQPTYQQSREGFVYFITLPLNFISRKKTARKNPVLNVMEILRIFLCTVQNLTRKTAWRSQEKNLKSFLSSLRVENSKRKRFFAYSKRNLIQPLKTECAKSHYH